MEPKVFSGIFGRTYSLMTPLMKCVYLNTIAGMDIPKNREISILEIGSGDGSMASLIIESHPLIKKYSLVDPAENQLLLAKNRLNKYDSCEIQYIPKTIEQLNDLHAEYDYVISFASLHHWNDIMYGIKNCVNACKEKVIIIDGIKNRKFSEIYSAIRDIGGGYLTALIYWIGSWDALSESVLETISKKISFPVTVTRNNLLYEFRIEKNH